MGPYEDPELPHGTKEAKMEEFFCVCVTLLDLSCLDESSLRVRGLRACGVAVRITCNP